MAFCTGCGSQIEDNAAFCTKCGTKTGVSVSPTSGAAAAPAMQAAPTKGSNTILKVILGVVGFFVILGVLGIAASFYFVHKVKQSIKVDQANSSIELPGMKIEAGKDPEKVAKQLDVDLYPGAKTTDASGIMTFGNVTTGSITLETTDSAQQVIDYYRAKYPKAQIMTSGDTHSTLITGDKNNMLSITADTSNGVTTIQISRTSGIGVPGPGSNDNG